MKKASSRRDFIVRSSVAGAGTLAGLNILPVRNAFTEIPTSAKDEKYISVKPRYYRWHVDKGMDWTEANTGHASLEWRVPVSLSALVLVDVWQRHYIKDPEARAEIIINEKMLPLLSAFRKAGVKIIHTPSPEVAVTHPNWVRIQTKEQVFGKHDLWPPDDFLSSKGDFEQYAMPNEPMEEVRSKMAPLTFHPKVLPQKGEPVIANGAELHEYLKQNKLLFLFYAGFNTNACIINRDYGTIRMRDKGYRIILIRDCTTGMESKDTLATLTQTKSTILNLEMFGCFTVESDEVISGLTL